MRKVLFLFQILIAIGAYAQESGAELTIRLQGVKPDGKKLMLGVGDFKKDPQRMKGEIVKADSSIVICTIKDIVNGKHFIYVYHDMNGNGKLDFSELGKPLEGVAMDENHSWEPSVLMTDSAQTINLTMYYLNKDINDGNTENE
ncbi:MAG: DUF2141 domain-containing protein [Bacteroidales bacterium]